MVVQGLERALDRGLHVVLDCGACLGRLDILGTFYRCLVASGVSSLCGWLSAFRKQVILLRADVGHGRGLVDDSLLLLKQLVLFGRQVALIVSNHLSDL